MPHKSLSTRGKRKTLIDKDVRKRGAKHSVHFAWISVGFEGMEMETYNGRVRLRSPIGPKTHEKTHTDDPRG